MREGIGNARQPSAEMSSPQFGQVTHVIIYPIKSCGAVVLDGPSEFTKLGLRHDRAWSVIDAASGAVLTLRDHPDLVKIRPRLEPDDAGRLQWLVLTRPADDAVTARVPLGAAAGTDAGDECAGWLRQLLGTDCRLRRTPAAFDSLPFSLVFSEDLDDLAQKIQPPDPRPCEVVINELMLRFRPNFVVSGISSDHGIGALAIGGVLLDAHTNRWADGCLRVVQVDPSTGEVTDEPVAALRRSVQMRPSEHPSKWEPVFGLKLSGGTDIPTTIAPGHIVIAETSKATPQLVRGVPTDKIQEEASSMEKDARMAAAAQKLALGQAACSSKAVMMANAWQPLGPPVPNKHLPAPMSLKEVSRGGTDIELSWSFDESAGTPTEFTVQYGYRVLGDWTTAPAPELSRESAAILPPAANFGDEIASKPPAVPPRWKARVVGLVGYTAYVFRVRAKIDGEWSYWSPTSKSISTRWSANTRTTKASAGQLSWVPCVGTVCTDAPPQPVIGTQPNPNSIIAREASHEAREARAALMSDADSEPGHGSTADVDESKIELKVESMVCGGCQASVQQALQSVAGVTSATVDLESGTAVVLGSATAEALIHAVGAAGKTASLACDTSELKSELRPGPEPGPEPEPEPEPSTSYIRSRFLPPSFLVSRSPPTPSQSGQEAKSIQKGPAPTYEILLLLDEPQLFRGCEQDLAASSSPTKSWLPRVPLLRWSSAAPSSSGSAGGEHQQQPHEISPPPVGQLKPKHVRPGTREATDVEVTWELVPAAIEPLQFEIEYGYRVRGTWNRATQVKYSVERQPDTKLALVDTGPGSGQPVYAHGIEKPAWMTKQIRPVSKLTSATSRQVDKITAECLALRTSSSEEEMTESAEQETASGHAIGSAKAPAVQHGFTTLNQKFMARVAGLTPNTSYTFRIRARDAIGWGAWASSGVISTLAASPSRVRTHFH